jgi:L-ascorbate metabolism protein UlaG (beta-lactamase superfamily)
MSKMCSPSFLFACSLVVASPAFAGEGIQITWLGHAAFEIVSPAGTKLLIDPFIAKNPSTPAEKKDLAQYKPDAILVTHSHGDHEGDAVEIAKASGAAIIGAFDHIGPLSIPDAQKLGGNVGGKIAIKELTVHLVPAVHGSNPGGRPLGFVIKFPGGKTIYHSGDTWIFSDMALIQEIHKPTILLLNVGGGPYTQDPKTAALAVKKYFKPKAIVPMHFGTFPPLAKEEDVKAAFKGDRRLVVLTPGQAASF